MADKASAKLGLTAVELIAAVAMFALAVGIYFYVYDRWIGPRQAAHWANEEPGRVFEVNGSVRLGKDDEAWMVDVTITNTSSFTIPYRIFHSQFTLIDQNDKLIRLGSMEAGIGVNGVLAHGESASVSLTSPVNPENCRVFFVANSWTPEVSRFIDSQVNQPGIWRVFEKENQSLLSEPIKGK